MGLDCVCSLVENRVFSQLGNILEPWTAVWPRHKISMKVPESLKAHAKWKEISESFEPFEIVEEDVFIEKWMVKSFKDSLETISSKMDQHLQSRGRQCNDVETFCTLLEPGMHFLVDHNGFD